MPSPLSSPQPSYKYPTFPFLLVSENTRTSQSPSSKMSLPYDLYVSLFLESLILDLSLLSNDLYDSRMAYVANEEWEVERQVVRTIISGNTNSLQPNSGQPITIRGHNITVGSQDERGSNHRVWEWHGHVMTYDEMNGYSLEYIHGHYFERMLERHGWRKADVEIRRGDLRAWSDMNGLFASSIAAITRWRSFILDTPNQKEYCFILLWLFFDI